MVLNKRANVFAGLFGISIAVLLFQISLTRIFSLVLFSNYAFMIISTAMFGIGLSGVILSIFPGLLKRFRLEHFLLFCCSGFALTVLLSFLVINRVPLEMANLKEIRNLVSLGIYYTALMIPFAFSGMVIAALFTKFTEDISRLYFFDLMGAGLGCLLTVPLFVKLGGIGTLYVVSLLGVLTGVLFSFRAGRAARMTGALLLAAWAVILPFWMKIDIRVHEFKRSYKMDVKNDAIEYSRWSSLSKIDVAEGPKDFFKRLWIDGGTNESALIRFDGEWGTEYLAGMDRLLIAIPYLAVDSPEVAIIGSSGGREVLLALNHDPEHVTAIEMDPTICRVVSETYADWIGNIFADPRVTLVCDEGRSFIRRSKKKFDIIHQVNNFTPIAMASGAINLAESYLLTEEAFREYLSRLTDRGMLALNRHNTFKIFILACKVLREMDKDPARHIIVVEGEDRVNNGFFMKKTPFTAEEVEKIVGLATERRLRTLYHPGIEKKDNWYVRLLESDAPESFYHLRGLNLTPPTDDKPFFEHIGSLGRVDVDAPGIPKGLLWVDSMKKVKRHVPIEDLILIAVFLEASLLSLVFIFAPLVFFNRRGVRTLQEIRVLSYFFAIGIAFILVEICLMQKFVLFLGVPVYAIAVVLFSLLSATGLGAYWTANFKPPHARNLGRAVAAIFAVLLVSNYGMPWTMQRFLGTAFPFRVLISIVLIFPLGLLMGMPFPLGMKILRLREHRLVPWAWGINAYSTVIGTVAAVALARSIGFKMVFITAGAVYIAGFLAIRGIASKQGEE